MIHITHCTLVHTCDAVAVARIFHFVYDLREVTRRSFVFIYIHTYIYISIYVWLFGWVYIEYIHTCERWMGMQLIFPTHLLLWH
jgi:hypothetical protein